MDITVEEAAQRLGISVATVKRRLQRNRSAGPNPRTSLHIAKAFQHLCSTDLGDLWVPDALSWADYVADPSDLPIDAADRAASGRCDVAAEVEVPKTAMLTRAASLHSLEDRIAFQALVVTLLPGIEAALSDRVYSSRAAEGEKYFFKKSTAQWVAWHRRVAKETANNPIWVAKTDLTAYFESIDHAILFRELDAMAVSPEVLSSLRSFLGGWSRTPGRGIPQGTNASRALGNFYLAAVDAAMLAAGVNYWRYMADVIIVASTKFDTVAGMRLFERECRKKGLIVSTLQDRTAVRRGCCRGRKEARTGLGPGT